MLIVCRWRLGRAKRD